METVARATLVACLVAVAMGITDPSISVTPDGLQFRVADKGYKMVGFHFNINKPLSGVTAGDFNVDLYNHQGDVWVYNVGNQRLNPGDTVYYWARAVRTDDSAEQVTDRSWTYNPDAIEQSGDSTLAAGTAATAATSVPDVTSGPSTGTGNGVASNVAVAHTSTSSSTNCSCNGARAGLLDGFVDSSGCSSYPCLVFEDNFDFLNHKVWEHEITAGGGGNWEFEYYTNNRSNSYTRDGILYIKPTLTADRYGEEFLKHGTLDLYGGGLGSTCTGEAFWGCKRGGSPDHILNPIQSARLRSSRGFSFKFGKVEVEAQLPAGDWIWPAIWMMPRLDAYGVWPTSGEIDIMESRGNRHYHDTAGLSQGADSVGMTMHFGPDYFHNQWPKAHAEKRLSSGTFADGFHKYGVDWSDDRIVFYVDDEEVLRVDPGPEGFWKFGGLDQLNGFDNPWRAGSKMAPFDQEFFLILNVAVGGTGFFNDALVNSPYPKPWSDQSGSAADEFWNARNLWYPTWNPSVRNGEDAALKVNYVRVWKTQPDA